MYHAVALLVLLLIELKLVLRGQVLLQFLINDIIELLSKYLILRWIQFNQVWIRPSLSIIDLNTLELAV
jgi:hypothetical protein